ncbi:hypothetical protein ASF84_01405 [Pseudomonas sp. Leaf127]|uniref:helix-turn-helix transcriptional regulator n=1 Tax=Pseudomonas sp. Leaf127 TaxID=1736267 RepID=UPI0007035E0D|nr:helix-turn-helix transcriptional regulator [Pseudomonas sp. Leaf127]KQQ67823.1 hypothetical protein ASF84_01405 [Pseudomonas sp. Leaf127]
MSALSKARRAANLTQQQLADLVHLTQAAIGHYERLRRTPGLSECRSIVRVLNSKGFACTLDDVFPEDEERREAA